MKKQELQQLIGENIKKARKSKNVPAQELASRCDIEKSSMSRLEAGKTNPTIYTLYKICKALEIKIEIIMKGI